MKQNDSSKIDQLLDLLLDALQERQAARGDELPDRQKPITESETVDLMSAMLTQAPTIQQTPSAQVEAEANAAVDTAESVEEFSPPTIPEKLPSIQLDRMLGRLAAFLLFLIIVINIPFNRFGTNLARAMPDEQALVIRDGLVLKGSGDEIYVLEDNHKRWISSLDAFEYYGYRWEQVNLVNDTFLEQFPDGPALSVLRRCGESPHVFAIENGVKRWIKDIPTFEAQGYVWEDVQVVSCNRLRSMPNGPPIPEDAGEPPIP